VNPAPQPVKNAFHAALIVLVILLAELLRWPWWGKTLLVFAIAGALLWRSE